jgi:hypothetical protein
MRNAFLWLAALAAALPAAARAEAPDCRNGIFVAEGVRYGLAKVTGDDKLFFVADAYYCDSGKPKDACPVCPGADALCRQKSYLVPGNVVVTARTHEAYRCVLYRDEKNVAGSAGYVPAERLEALPSAEPALADWAGEWRKGDDVITLRVSGGKLRASGEAYWPSANPSPRDVPGGPHTGQMSGVAAPTGASVRFVDSEEDCEVTLTLLPPLLLARDNNSCGGMNVRFDGVYMRAQGGKKR